MTKKEIIQFFVTQSENHRNTARDFYSSKHYDWCLFVWHLAIEKLLKAKLLSSGKEIIYTHNLSKLYLRTKLPSTKEIINQLDEITSFNLEARYDDYKFAFYNKATKTYALHWIAICEELYMSISTTL